MESGDDAAAQALLFDYRDAQLAEEDRALCEFAVKLTLAPGEMGAADAARLRELGFSDGAITVATQVISYFNYINRIADGLGVDPESWMTPSKDEWLARRGTWTASTA